MLALPPFSTHLHGLSSLLDLVSEWCMVEFSTLPAPTWLPLCSLQGVGMADKGIWALLVPKQQ